VIPIMDKLQAHLDRIHSDEKISKIVRHAVVAGTKVLNKYYLLTDDSPFYRVAMYATPNFKLQYFKSQKWPDEWIEEVKHLRMEYLEKNYPDVVRVWDLEQK
ncbi:hypothetical protein BT69DRAFT_1210469, partial [Atractiella rhizophila]